jgi:hypothetical protein
MQCNRPTSREKVLAKQVAGHFLMGASLGTAAALILLISNTGAIRELVAGGAAPAMPIGVFVAMCACTIAIGATLTGVIFSAMDDR